MKRTAIILTTQCGDWEALYIDGYLIDEGHSLEDPQYWIDWTKEFSLDSVEFHELNDTDNERTLEYGAVPDLEDLTGEYKHLIENQI